MPEAKEIAINGDLDIVTARVEGRNLARTLGFGIIDQARIATAISELARNIVLYARTGKVMVRPVEHMRQRGIEVVCSDKGPGIPDVALVMQDGYSSHRGLGMGLPGTKRLMDEFEIVSAPGAGTMVTVRKWLK
jgi:serine/threonine-protein kinase RsbT